MKIYPNEYFKSVKDISIEYLEKKKIKGLVLDVDNTLIDCYRNMPEGILDWCNKLKENGIKFCILSNSNKEDKIKEVARVLDIPYISFGKKPLKKGFLKAKDILNIEANEIAVVGDQIFTDILGANRVGMYSILLEPIDEKDIFITRFKRPVENLIMKTYQKKKEK